MMNGGSCILNYFVYTKEAGDISKVFCILDGVYWDWPVNVDMKEHSSFAVCMEPTLNF